MIWVVAERSPLLLISVPGFITMVIGILLGIYTFQYFNQNNFDYVVTIDGDGQHNPLEIPAVLGIVMNNEKRLREALW